jgi:hypothetical protein
MGKPVGGLIGALPGSEKRAKKAPNQGIRLSRNSSLAVFLFTFLSVELIGGVIGELSKKDCILGLRYGLIGGLIFGLIAALNRGGSAVIKHYALRLILWLKGYAPFNFIKFLDQCARLIFLKKVGGGYIFIHRMLLDYFAELDTPRNSAIER